MMLDDLKITILRATRPGDIVFFQITREPDAEFRSLITALADYLREAHVTPVMLPDAITVVGSIFSKEEMPRRRGISLKNHIMSCNLWDLAKPMICTCGASVSDPEDIQSRLENWHTDSTDQEGLYELLSDAFHAIRQLRNEVKEWLCADCNFVYPGPPQTGFGCVICPRCQGRTAPRQTVEIRKLEDRIAALQQVKECTYTQSEPGSSLWLSSCGRDFCLEPGLVLDAFCRWCGGQIAEVGASLPAPPSEPPQWKAFDGTVPPTEIKPT